MATRLGLDIGTNSIGWALLELEDGQPSGVIRTGVRIFSDGRNPKDKSSLAVARRLARQQRRMRDRKIKRQNRLLDALVDAGLMPSTDADRKSHEHLDPLEIRAKALDQLIDPHHLGRALFHLSKRRGFKSNRKTDGAESESGIIASSVARTKEQMEVDGARTYGEWLYMRKMRGEGIRARTTGAGAQKSYEVYSDRALTEQEIDLLFLRQRELGSTQCGDSTHERIKEIILFQRDLLPVSPGNCTFESSEPRGALAHPLVQEFRIYQELNNLRIVDSHYKTRSLTLEQRDRLAKELQGRPKLDFKQIKKLLSLADKEQLNFESTRDFLVGNQTNVALKKVVGKHWLQLPDDIKISVVESLLSANTDEELLADLEAHDSLTPEDKLHILSANLVDGYGKLSIKAIEKILPHLKEDVITYNKAAAFAGYNHSDQYTGEWHRELPYYGKILQQYTGMPVTTSDNDDEATYGRIANPTVHIALNQLRKIINAIIKKYGHPDEIHLEIVRDLKLSQKAKREIEKTQKENQKRNDRHRERLSELGLKDTYDNRLRLTLWEELAEQPMDRCCPFSGQRIGIESLFTAAIQIEHLIPFADCLDDSQANKTLATRKANNDKGKKTPYEAFGDDQNGYCWQDILDRVDRLPANKRRRFYPEARQLFSGDEWLARQLNDTAYIARVARQYVTAICPPNCVRVVPGRLTALFRRALGLEPLLGDGDGKNRFDHRHHAIDAVVVALTENRLIHQASRSAGNDAIERLSERMAQMDAPWQGFREDVSNSINRILVSHKPDHGTAAALHNETAYGIVSGPDDRGVSTIRYRKRIADLKEKDLEKVNDPVIRHEIQRYLDSSSESHEKAIAAFAQTSRAQKCTLEEKLSVVHIQNQSGTPYKAYKPDGNYCYEIEWLEDGAWGGRVISNFEANQKPYQNYLMGTASRHRSFGGRPLAMRLCRDDIIALEENGLYSLLRVIKISDGKITLASLTEANVDARNRDSSDPFKLFSKAPNALKNLNARRVFVDVIGVLKDPGKAKCREES